MGGVGGGVGVGGGGGGGGGGEAEAKIDNTKLFNNLLQFTDFVATNCDIVFTNIQEDTLEPYSLLYGYNKTDDDINRTIYGNVNKAFNAPYIHKTNNNQHNIFKSGTIDNNTNVTAYFFMKDINLTQPEGSKKAIETELNRRAEFRKTTDSSIQFILHIPNWEYHESDDDKVDNKLLFRKLLIIGDKSGNSIQMNLVRQMVKLFPTKFPISKRGEEGIGSLSTCLMGDKYLYLDLYTGDLLSQLIKSPKQLPIENDADDIAIPTPGKSIAGKVAASMSATISALCATSKSARSNARTDVLKPPIQVLKERQLGPVIDGPISKLNMEHILAVLANTVAMKKTFTIQNFELHPISEGANADVNSELYKSPYGKLQYVKDDRLYKPVEQNTEFPLAIARDGSKGDRDFKSTSSINYHKRLLLTFHKLYALERDCRDVDNKTELHEINDKINHILEVHNILAKSKLAYTMGMKFMQNQDELIELKTKITALSDELGDLRSLNTKLVEINKLAARRIPHAEGNRMLNETIQRIHKNIREFQQLEKINADNSFVDKLKNFESYPDTTKMFLTDCLEIFGFNKQENPNDFIEHNLSVQFQIPAIFAGKAMQIRLLLKNDICNLMQYIQEIISDYNPTELEEVKSKEEIKAIWEQDTIHEQIATFMVEDYTILLDIIIEEQQNVDTAVFHKPTQLFNSSYTDTLKDLPVINSERSEETPRPAIPLYDGNGNFISGLYEGDRILNTADFRQQLKVSKPTPIEEDPYSPLIELAHIVNYIVEYFEPLLQQPNPPYIRINVELSHIMNVFIDVCKQTIYTLLLQNQLHIFNCHKLIYYIQGIVQYLTSTYGLRNISTIELEYDGRQIIDILTPLVTNNAENEIIIFIESTNAIANAVNRGASIQEILTMIKRIYDSNTNLCITILTSMYNYIYDIFKEEDKANQTTDALREKLETDTRRITGNVKWDALLKAAKSAGNETYLTIIDDAKLLSNGAKERAKIALENAIKTQTKPTLDESWTTISEAVALVFRPNDLFKYMIDDIVSASYTISIKRAIEEEKVDINKFNVISHQSGIKFGNVNNLLDSLLTTPDINLIKTYMENPTDDDVRKNIDTQIAMLGTNIKLDVNYDNVFTRAFTQSKIEIDTDKILSILCELPELLKLYSIYTEDTVVKRKLTEQLESIILLAEYNEENQIKKIKDASLAVKLLIRDIAKYASASSASETEEEVEGSPPKRGRTFTASEEPIVIYQRTFLTDISIELQKKFEPESTSERIDIAGPSVEKELKEPDENVAKKYKDFCKLKDTSKDLYNHMMQLLTKIKTFSFTEPLKHGPRFSMFQSVETQDVIRGGNKNHKKMKGGALSTDEIMRIVYNVVNQPLTSDEYEQLYIFYMDTYVNYGIYNDSDLYQRIYTILFNAGLHIPITNIEVDSNTSLQSLLYKVHTIRDKYTNQNAFDNKFGRGLCVKIFGVNLNYMMYQLNHGYLVLPKIYPNISDNIFDPTTFLVIYNIIKCLCLEFAQCTFLHTYYLQLNIYINEPYTNLFDSFDSVNTKILTKIKDEPKFFNTFKLLQKSFVEQDYERLTPEDVDNFNKLKNLLLLDNIHIEVPYILFADDQSQRVENTAMGEIQASPYTPHTDGDESVYDSSDEKDDTHPLENTAMGELKVPPVEVKNTAMDVIDSSPYTPHTDVESIDDQSSIEQDKHPLESDDDAYDELTPPIADGPIKSSIPHKPVKSSITGNGTLSPYLLKQPNSFYSGGNRDNIKHTKSKSLKHLVSRNKPRQKTLKRKIIIEVKG